MLCIEKNEMLVKNEEKKVLQLEGKFGLRNTPKVWWWNSLHVFAMDVFDMLRVKRKCLVKKKRENGKDAE
jgi:uncharacterized protein YhhL (DUF1145 family)